MTLSTSVTNKYGKIALIYLLISIFFALFGGVYEHFSFGVYSYFMLYAFAFPLLGGALPALILCVRQSAFAPWPISCWFYRCGIATLTLGSIIRGILDIYGTANDLTIWYLYAGLALVALGALLFTLKAFLDR